MIHGVYNEFIIDDYLKLYGGLIVCGINLVKIIYKYYNVTNRRNNSKAINIEKNSEYVMILKYDGII